MFRFLNKQGVESDEGFSVQVLSRYKIQYSDLELKKSLTLDTDYGFNASMEACMILENPKFDRWDDGVSLNAAEQEQVKARFASALEAMKVRVAH